MFKSSNIQTKHYGDSQATGAIANYFGLGPAVQPFITVVKWD
ncbi:hypothetical protein [Photorhabdus heterorhabditis]|nr:hypothetical protein [Photorhabdus heterorhabditis]